MNEAYVKLMLRQEPSANMDAAFYEKLSQTPEKKTHRISWKAAIAVMCVLLLIPVTVWAAENIFGVTKVTVCERPIEIDNLPGIGMDVVYENIENFDPKDFPKHLQKLEEGEILLHTSMEEVEDYLGLDLIDNTVLTADDTHLVGAFGEPGKNFQTFCGVWEGHLIFTEVQSVYNRNDIRLKVTATATAEHPTLDEAQYHSTSITYIDEHNREILSEQYVTKTGIPVLIVTVTETDYRRTDNRALTDCFAFFAVNNISYKVEISSWAFDSDDKDTYASPDEKIIDTLWEVLDGFEIE